jgi:hypothetical protein
MRPHHGCECAVFGDGAPGPFVSFKVVEECGQFAAVFAADRLAAHAPKPAPAP